MTEYKLLANDVKGLLINQDIQCIVNANSMTFEYSGIDLQPISTHYPLMKFEKQVETGTRFLGDGFQMLCQTAGTIENQIDIGRCPDNSPSYRIYSEHAPKRFYNYLVLEQSTGFQLFGFTSCDRFAGYFELQPGTIATNIIAYIDGENIKPKYWSNNKLESIAVLKGASLDCVFQQYADLITKTHPLRKGVNGPVPIGWCSWYAYYSDVSAQDVKNNVKIMTNDMPDLEWVLLDDGYQAFMGDWLSPSEKFSGGVKSLINEIKVQGKKPAIWLAPFIAQPESEVFRQHPEWFLKHSDGTLLKAEDITYGGWRCTPWYILDPSHPEVSAYLTHVVSVMRNQWGVELFKLDANYWGTLKGIRHQAGVTGVEAYRMGMQAILKGAGDAIVLGCNSPMWPSLGLVDAMRVSDDVERSQHRFKQIAKETFYRSWQHQRLWLIDPDCATFTSLPNQATNQHTYQFHRDVLLASGGLLLSGDPLPEMTSFARETLVKLIERQKTTNHSAVFNSLNLQQASLKLSEKQQLHCLFNYENKSSEYSLTSDSICDWYDFWTGQKLNEIPTQVFVASMNHGLSSRSIISIAQMDSYK
ncbi:MAG: alpha-galactosidase [Psychromonas sp.]